MKDEPKKAVLAVPACARQHFSQNFIKTAVCEFRFPTLHEIDGPKPPLAFAKALRKDYPTHSIMSGVNVSPTNVDRSTTHVFKSKKGQWAVNLRPSTLSLETSRYDSFDDFEKRIADLVAACQSFIDSDFFTRVGIRYVNMLPYDRSKISDWINPTLVRNLESGIFGDATEHSQQVRGTTDEGGFFLNHGLGADGEKVGYGVDLDFYADDVEVTDAMEVVRKLHVRQYDLFMWVLGDGAKQKLNEAEA